MTNLLRTLLIFCLSMLLAAGWVIANQAHFDSGKFPSVLSQSALLIFAIQWLAFVPSYLCQSEKIYDLTGSATFILVIFYALWQQPSLSVSAVLLAAAVCVWAARLGTFLFMRVLKAGSDNRFEQIKSDPLRFFTAWTLQGLWVLLTLGPALTVIAAPQSAELAFLTLVGLAIWLCGWLLEVVADHQKTRFKQQQNPPKPFIDWGLWRYSRHPNYVGEILLWCGVAIAALPLLHGWQHLALVSPFFVTLLLTKVSGIPMLEASAEQRWGHNPDYQQYQRQTPVLFPRLFSK